MFEFFTSANFNNNAAQMMNVSDDVTDFMIRIVQ